MSPPFLRADFERAVDAVMHVLDGERAVDVAERYGYSLIHLRALLSASHRPEVIGRAIDLYSAYRREGLKAGERRWHKRFPLESDTYLDT